MKRDDDLNREIEAHIEMEAEELRADGVSGEEARVRAKRTFGNAALAAERTREVWPWVWLENLAKSVQLALRRASHAPGFTATVTLVIALAVGVSTALFSFADVVFFKPLPYPEPERLLAVSVQVQSSAGRSFDNCCDGEQWEALSTHSTKFDRAVYSGGTAGVNLATGDRAILVKQHRVGRDFFATLGMPPALGRSFNAEEDTTNGPAAVVISDALRRRLFGDGRNPVGEKILLKGEPFEVVGVMAPNFYAGVRADLWTPLRASTKGEGQGTNFAMMIRLRPGVTQAEALSELGNLSREIPPRPANKNGETFSQRFIVRPLLEGRTEGIRTPMLVLLGAVGIVLLIGAVNVGGLLLARQSGRAAELATRMALGASAGQIFSEVLLDSLVVISMGGLLALPAAWVALEGLKSLTAEMTSLGDSAVIDARCLLVAAVMTLAAGLIAGLFPAWQATRTQPRGGSARGVAGRSRKIPLGSLVMAQVALFVPLLIGAGLLGRSFLSLWNANPGFDASNISVARFSLQENRYADRDKVDRLMREGVAQMAQIPGVESVAAGLHMPLERWLNMNVRFRANETGRTGNMNYVTPNYFTALRIPILRGRNFSEGDNATGEKVAIVNEAMVKMFLEGRDPLNESILLRDGLPYRIVGVVGDTQQRGGWGSYGPLHPMPAFYVTVAQTDGQFLKLVHNWFSPAWIVRSRLDQATLARQLEGVMRGLDPMLPIASFSTPTEIKSLTLGTQLLTVTLISAISGLGLLLCVLGVYGLVSSGVTERTREIGIRLALGATRAGVVSAAMRPGLLWAAAGIAIGAPLAYLGREVVSKLLYKVEVTDPVALAVIAVVLLGAVGAASLLPALKLARLDPAVTLRDE